MKLLFIYGSPAVGKLTVANEIAKRSDFRVFHNHLTIEAVLPVFEFGTEPFWNLVHSFRILTVAEAARANQNVIYTFCYAKDEDDDHVAKIKNAVEENGGKVCFVLLKANMETIEKRLGAASREQYSKIKNLEEYRKMVGSYDVFSPVPHAASLIIDNTNVSAANAANAIIQHFRLA